MSHEFETGFFVHEPAWHGLGTVLDEAPTMEDAIIQAGLDWKVKTCPLYTNFGVNFIDNEQCEANTGSVFTPSHKAVVRETDNKLLGIVGKMYTPVQNIDAFSWFDTLLQNNDATLEAGGSLCEGRKIWVLAKMNIDSADVVKGDEVCPYLLFSNTHDGMMSVWIQFTPIRVVCNNTLTVAMSNRYKDELKGKALRIKHTMNVSENLVIAKQLIDVTSQLFTDQLDAYRLFTKKDMTAEELHKYYLDVFKDPNKEITDEDIDKDLTRREAAIINLFENGSGTDIPGVSGTVWAAYNAVTEWVDHFRGYTGAEKRLDAAWFGEGATLKRRAFAQALKVSQ